MKTRFHLYYIYYIMCVAILLPALLSGCYNNGDIGIYYGSWSLESYTVDGATPADFVPGDWVWSFQGRVVCIEHNLGKYNEHEQSFGTWTETSGGSHIELNFTHSDNVAAPGTGIYAAPTYLGFEPNCTIVLDVVKAKGRTLVLEYVDSQGVSYIYDLKKTW